ncbi:MAG TPA: hypothetical protein VFZ08_12590 [Terriglobia bacterium]|nr:hypothetical protein [Terriglobia bacterium]
MQPLAQTHQHTECFTCSRFYFGETLTACPRCGSQALQHYSTEEMNLFARDVQMAPHPVPRPHLTAHLAE